VETFVIRVWTPAAADEAEPDVLRGLAEHVGSGNATAFRDAGELVSFLATTLGARHVQVDPA
jgi:hypothetical protein